MSSASTRRLSLGSNRLATPFNISLKNCSVCRMPSGGRLSDRMCIDFRRNVRVGFLLVEGLPTVLQQQLKSVGDIRRRTDPIGFWLSSASATSILPISIRSFHIFHQPRGRAVELWELLKTIRRLVGSPAPSLLPMAACAGSRRTKCDTADRTIRNYPITWEVTRCHAHTQPSCHSCCDTRNPQVVRDINTPRWRCGVLRECP